MSFPWIIASHPHSNSTLLFFLFYIHRNRRPGLLTNFPRTLRLEKVIQGLAFRSVQLKSSSSSNSARLSSRPWWQAELFMQFPELNTSVFFDSSHFLITTFDLSPACQFYLEKDSFNLFPLFPEPRSLVCQLVLIASEFPLGTSIQSSLHGAVKAIFKHLNLIVSLPCLRAFYQQM